MKTASNKKARRASTTSNDNILDRLPQELIVDIVAQLVASSPSPLADLRSVRATCRSFRDASAKRDVARRVQMGREQSLRWSDKERYLAALASFASYGNPDAMFLLGLEQFFGGVSTIRSGDAADEGAAAVIEGTRSLVDAVVANHDVAKYVVGVLFFCLFDEDEDDDTRQRTVNLLNELQNNSHRRRCRPSHCVCGVYLEECRRQASSAIRDITMEKFDFDPRPGKLVTCTDSSTCGRTIVKRPEPGGEWSALRQEPQFCSQFCRWREECCKFFKNL